MSNGKVCFDSFWPEYLEPSLLVVHFDRSDRSLPFHFDKSVHCPTSRRLCREFGKGINMERDIPLCWPGLFGNCRFIFFGYSHWSLTGRSGTTERPHYIHKSSLVYGYVTIYCGYQFCGVVTNSALNYKTCALGSGAHFVCHFIILCFLINRIDWTFSGQVWRSSSVAW